MAFMNRSYLSGNLALNKQKEGGDRCMAHKGKTGKKVKPSLMKAILREVARAIG
jgi:hypothetical protein